MATETSSPQQVVQEALYPEIKFSVVTRQRDQSELAFWGDVRAQCPRLSPTAIARYFLNKMPSLESVIIEHNYICKDHRNLFSHFYAKKFLPSDPYTSRIHFFKKSYAEVSDFLRDENPSDHYLGYSVIRQTSLGSIGRTVLTPMAFGRTNDNFFCLTTKFKVHLVGRILVVAGYPMMSQDTEATACAHVALWGICRYLSERYSAYREMYPYDMVLMTSPDLGRTSPYGRMTFDDFSRVLTSFGCHPIVRAYHDDTAVMTPADFRNFYSYVESGIPLAASIGAHAIAVIGHTWKRKMPARPRYWHERLIDSSEFMEGLVVIDDNFAPYQILDTNGTSPQGSYGQILAANMPATNRRTSAYKVRDIVSMIVPMPDKAFLPAEKAREVFQELLKDLKELDPNYFNQDIITRMFITTGSAVKAAITEKMKKHLLVNRGERRLFYTVLPHFVWVMETATPDEYFARTASGRLILDATANPKEQCLIAGYVTKFLINSIKVPNVQGKFGRTPLAEPIPPFPMLTDNFRN